MNDDGTIEQLLAAHTHIQNIILGRVTMQISIPPAPTDLDRIVLGAITAALIEIRHLRGTGV
jgi:ABC-type transport system involved in cytochrome c biogenesis permease component